MKVRLALLICSSISTDKHLKSNIFIKNDALMIPETFETTCFHHRIFHFQSTRLYLNIQIFFHQRPKSFLGVNFEINLIKVWKRNIFPLFCFLQFFLRSHPAIVQLRNLIKAAIGLNKLLSVKSNSALGLLSQWSCHNEIDWRSDRHRQLMLWLQDLSTWIITF